VRGEEGGETGGDCFVLFFQERRGCIEEKKLV